jgi:release factor H-coupled RctB family protein
MGTIGAGNHFAELQQIDDVLDAAELKRCGLAIDRVFLLVHSGSRGLGEAVLRAYLESEACLCHETAACTHYLGGHDLAVRWARANRKLIAQRFLELLGWDAECVWDASHNAISNEQGRWVHRKGASPAHAKFVVIPGSRGSYSYVVAPNGDLSLDRLVLAARRRSQVEPERKPFTRARASKGRATRADCSRQPGDLRQSQSAL